jgi:hypothetical protein
LTGTRCVRKNLIIGIIARSEYPKNVKKQRLQHPEIGKKLDWVGDCANGV